MKAAVDDLVCDDRCQPREHLNDDAVRDYAECYSRKKHGLPPVDVYRVGDELVVVDGFHRVAAARGAGRTFLPINEVGAGSMEEAIWHASAVNQDHGVRRTNADKRRSVLNALSVAADRSLRDIASHVGVSHELVRKVRSELSTVDSSEAGEVATVDTPRASEVVTVATPRDGLATPKQLETLRDHGLNIEGEATFEEAQGLIDAMPAAESPRPGVALEADDEEPPPSTPQADFQTAVDMPDAAPLRAVAKAIRATRTQARSALPGGLSQRIDQHLTSAIAAVEYEIPAVCDECEGVGCNRCGGRGWRAQGEMR